MQPRPSAAAVEPMVRSPITGDALPLVDQVRSHLGRRGLIAIVGGPRFGKTTALAHLRARIGELDVGCRYFDAPDLREVRAVGGLLVYACARPFPRRHLAVLELQRWGADEAVEYLLARHRDRCSSVMSRLAGHERLVGNPELWRAVLDTLAAHASIGNVPAALARLASRMALSSPLSLHAPIRLAREAVELVVDVRAGIDAFPPVHPDVIREAAPQLADDVDVHVALRAILGLEYDDRQAVAASLLHFAGANSRPPATGKLDLEGAYVPNVRWPGVQLAEARLAEAVLVGADLHRADLDAADLTHANLARANLAGASLRDARAIGVNLQSADLSHAHASHIMLRGADLRRADLSGARLERAVLSGGDLRDACFQRANLRHALLGDAQVDGADFRGADLSKARLRGLSLHTTRLDGACLERAFLAGANLSGVALDRCRMAHATLIGADLTDASLRGATLRGASLSGACAGDLDAEGADLRDADLSRMTFHFGSSRSGRVESDIASEGTRTGYYTDEFEERHFKAPEDIRVANLRGADLRGADVAKTDFYLVDLRDAKYDAKQEEHFHGCRAILSTRV